MGRVWHVLVALGATGLVLGQTSPAEAATPLNWVNKTAPPAGGPLVGDGHGDLFTFAVDAAGTGLTAYEYNPKTNRWSTRATDSSYAPQDADGGFYWESATLAQDGRIIVLGGNGNANNDDLASVAAYSPAHNTWQTLAPLPHARYGAAAVTGPQGKIYAIGGDFGGDSGGNGEVTLQSVEAYSPTKNSWQELAPLNDPRYFAAAAVGSNGLIYVFGGCQQGPNNAGDCSDADTAEVLNPSSALNTWQLLPTMPTYFATCGMSGLCGPGAGGGAAATNGLIYLNGVGAYNPANGTWTAFSTSPATPLLVAPGGSKCAYLYGLGYFTGTGTL